MKKLMMLGAGSCQLSAIKRIKELGFTAVVSDNRLESPGKRIADVSVLADTFSFDETLVAARREEIDGIMTSGTDQPVLMVNQVAEFLDLPQVINSETALWVTNKKNMKEKFTALGIPTVAYALCKIGFDQDELAHLKAPYVMKPVDSQGQRGIFKVATIADIRRYMPEVLAYSRCEEVLIESYYENEEVSVTGWVEAGQLHVLTITDRVTFNSDHHIGVCTAHEYPSRHLIQYRNRIMRLTSQICQGFDIKDGPIYFQYLVGEEGVLVNEIACRIGGAYEDVFVPVVTGVDILSLRIFSAIAPEDYRLLALKKDLSTYNYDETGTRISVQLFFCRQGIISHMTPKEHILQESYVLDMGYNLSLGQTCGPIKNASQRAGYMVVAGSDEETLHKNIKKAYEKMQVLDENGQNIVIKGKRLYR